MYRPRARAPTMVCSFKNKFHQLAAHCSVFTPDEIKWLKRSVGLPWSQQGRAAIIFCRWQHRLQLSMTNAWAWWREILTESSKSLWRLIFTSLQFCALCEFWQTTPPTMRQIPPYYIQCIWRNRQIAPFPGSRNDDHCSRKPRNFVAKKNVKTFLKKHKINSRPF